MTKETQGEKHWEHCVPFTLGRERPGRHSLSLPSKSLFYPPLEGGLEGLSLRVSNEGFLFHIPPKGVARLAFSARIGRAQFHRARSASKKGTWPLLPHPYFLSL